MNMVKLMQIQMRILWKFRMDVYGCIMMQLGNFDIMTTFIDIYDYLHILIVVGFTTGGSARVLLPGSQTIKRYTTIYLLTHDNVSF
jgi:hypothetical protein